MQQLVLGLLQAHHVIVLLHDGLDPVGLLLRRARAE